jgi:hypothetical protein
MLVDAFLPEGVTHLAVDSIFMMPQLGVLAGRHEKAATEVFDKDCLVWLGACIAPVGVGKEGQRAVEVRGTTSEGRPISMAADFGRMAVAPLPAGATAEIEIIPGRGLDVGAGKGRARTAMIRGGVVGILVDARGRRPFELPSDPARRVAKLREWAGALDLYPREAAPAGRD